MTEEEVNRHEAGHATACMLLKIPLAGFGRHSDGGGYTRLIDFLQEDFDRARVKDYLLMIMCGPIMQEIDLPEWPLSRDAHQLDERYMSIFADHLGLDQIRWLETVVEAYNFTETPEFRYLWGALTGLADRKPMGAVGRFGLDYAQDLVQRVQRDREGGEP